MVSETLPTIPLKTLPVNDGLSLTRQIKVGEYGCTIVFRPATGLRAIGFQRSRTQATGDDLGGIYATLIREQVSEIQGTASRHNPREVSAILESLDCKTIIEIVEQVVEAAWEVEKLLSK